MERIINKEIQQYLTSNKLITNGQHGFCKKRSTCSNLLECVFDWAYSIESKYHTDIIYFDFKKAFDSVSHPKLLIKLKSYGLDGKLFQWLNNFLSNRRQLVTINNAISDQIDVTSGVPQGSVLGPTLFHLFINDIRDILTDINVKFKLFADDLKLYSTRSNANNVNDLSIAFVV